MRSSGEFKKAFMSLCGKHAPYAVWQDMVQMIACEISNSVDRRHADARERRYQDIRVKYTPEEMERFAQLFKMIVMSMEENTNCDYLGDMYMRLEFGSRVAGQVFTPYNVCRMMAKMSVPDMREQIEENGWCIVHDCACGAGATLIAAANALKDAGVNFQQHALFIGQDLDATVALMCYIQLSLLGCAGYVRIGDTLTHPATGDALFGDIGEDTWYTPMFYHENWHMRRTIKILMLGIETWRGDREKV